MNQEKEDKRTVVVIAGKIHFLLKIFIGENFTKEMLMQVTIKPK